MSSPIEDYALIGDGETAALISKDGSIDWLCWPRFDSDACFAALLGRPENGRWIIKPVTPGIVKRRYRSDTLVLETEYICETGTVRVIDFMPMRQQSSVVIRIVEGVSGTVSIRMELCVRGNYGAVPPWFERVGETFIGCAGAGRFSASGTFGMQVEGEDLTAEFDVAKGETLHMMLRYAEAVAAPDTDYVEPLQALADTERFWRSWIERFDKATEWPNDVKRSLITLKALIYRPSGGIVAAPTTSLPEAPGGKLNWDYRLSWIRDASFTLCALLNAGFHEEAIAWRDWILRTVGAEPRRLRIMYRVDGERHIPESEIDWLEGYNHAKPVRIGNGASTQHQADVYGELIDAMHLAARAGIARTPHSIAI
jgi:GH15 family glucan-1,4-alpha-glucosidase